MISCDWSSYVCFFFFKQKTAYEMVSCDWSSDVCSSDLPLASGGIDMERALVMYLRERNGALAGRKIELFVGDSGGVPAQARTKIQELVEREHIQVMIGPLATAEALAADDYIRQQQLLTLS